MEQFDALVTQLRAVYTSSDARQKQDILTALESQLDCIKYRAEMAQLRQLLQRSKS